MNLEPSSVKLYINPFWPSTNPTTGCLIFVVSIDSPGSKRHERHRSVNPDFPAFAIAKARERIFLHEDDQDRFHLATELESLRRGRSAVVVD